MSEQPPSDHGGIDWRRLASERNVPLGVARALWERACAAAPDDPVQAEHAFLLLLDDAEAADIAQPPGRGTLAASTPDARDAFSLGPGKWTRVLLEQPKPARPGGVAQWGAATGKRPSAEELHNEIVAAEQAGKQVAAMLAAADPSTIVEALLELRGREGSGVVQRVMSMAGGVVERIVSLRSQGAPAQAAPAQADPATTGPDAGDPVAEGTLDRAPDTAPIADVEGPDGAGRTP